MVNGDSGEPRERCLPLQTCLPFLGTANTPSHRHPPKSFCLFFTALGRILLPLCKALSSRMEMGFAAGAEGASPAVCEQVTGCSTTFALLSFLGSLESTASPQVQSRTEFGSLVLAQITQCSPTTRGETTIHPFLSTISQEGTKNVSCVADICILPFIKNPLKYDSKGTKSEIFQPTLL